MAKPPKYRLDGEPSGTGHAEASLATRFGVDDGRRRPGRKKGAKSMVKVYTALAKIPVVWDQGGEKRKISTKEGIALKQRDKALKGDQRASERLLDKFEALDPPEARLDLTAALIAEDIELIAGLRARGLLGPIEPPTSPGDGQ